MSRGLNKVMIIGHLGRDPEMRYTPSGRPVTTFSVATNRSWTTSDGEKRTRERLARYSDCIMEHIAEMLPESYRGRYGPPGRAESDD